LGRALERFFQGYKAGGIRHAVTQFALQSLRGGPFYDGPANYASVEHMPLVLERFGFRLLDVPPMTVQGKGEHSAPAHFLEQLNDPVALAQRLESSEEFAAQFAEHPEITRGFAQNVSLSAIKV
jgi:hypothetical protein